MTITLYEMSKTGHLIPIDDNVGQNLPVGAILHWGGNMGWSERDFAVLAEDEKGYWCFDMQEPENNARLHFVEYGSIKRKDDPAIWHNQHFFLTGRSVGSEQLEAMQADHKQQQEVFAIGQAAAKVERERLEAEGRELWKKLVPTGTTHLIIAERIIDDTDLQTDYFGNHTVETVILATSKHGRNLFSEMRKAAPALPETVHLATADAEAEHRAKYSGGDGYYLQAGHSSGWRISKTDAYSWRWNSETNKHENTGEPQADLLVALAMRYDHLRK